MPDFLDFAGRLRAASKGLTAQPAELVPPKGMEPDAEDDGLDVATTEMTETLAPEEAAKQEAVETKVSAVSINLFQHPDAHPVVLDLALLKKYGPEWMLWESETLAWRVPQDFRTTNVSDLNMHKIEAMKTMHFVDSYWQRWEVFNWCTQPLNGMYPDFETLQVPTVAQLMVSVDIAARVRTDVEWTQEVKDFMIQACRFDGIFCPPEPLEFLNVGTEHGLIDCAEIKKRWPKVLESGTVPAPTNVVAEQLGRMYDVQMFLDKSRKRLQSQLRLVADV